MNTQDYGKTLNARMEKYREVPRYTMVMHSARAKLGLSLVEYCVIDGIHNLSHRPNHPYCTLSKDNMGTFLGVNRATIFRALTKGFTDNLLEKNDRGDLRTTDKWILEVVVKKEQVKAQRDKRNS